MDIEEKKGNDEELSEALEKINDSPTAQPDSSPSFWENCKKILSHIFIDGLSGMAQGLFATLIIGTIICQIGSLIGDNRFGYFVRATGSIAKVLMGAGIGVGVALKFKKPTLVTVSAAVAGMLGAFSSKIIDGQVFNEAMSVTTLISVGEPLGAFIAAFVAAEVGALVAGKTKVDIIVTPIVAIAAGSLIGFLIGHPISTFMTAIGNLINTSAQQQPVLMGILVAVLMGVALTLPISSAAIGVTLGLSGIAAGSAVVGCCCHMVGFAVISFRENKWGGLVAQGVGTSMIQMPNLVKHPLCWLPPVIASAVLGPIAAVFGVTSTPVGSGMGTSGLVGVIETYSSMINGDAKVGIALLKTGLFTVILPALLTLVLGEVFRKFKLIKEGELKLD